MVARLLTVLVAGLFLASDAPKEDAKKIVEKVQGSWEMLSAEENGDKIENVGLTMTVKDDQITLGNNEFLQKRYGKMTFQLDPSPKPPTFDVKIVAGEEKGVTLLGIYELDGDKLTICVNVTGKERPKEFKTANGSGNSVLRFKRKKV